MILVIALAIVKMIIGKAARLKETLLYASSAKVKRSSHLKNGIVANAAGLVQWYSPFEASTSSTICVKVGATMGSWRRAPPV